MPTAKHNKTCQPQSFQISNYLDKDSGLSDKKQYFVLFFGIIFRLLISSLNIRRPDYFILMSLDNFARKHEFLDAVFHEIIDRNTFSNILLITICVFCWFCTKDATKKMTLLAGMVAAVGASILSRLMQLSLPMHVRPLHDPALHFRVPSGIDPEALNHWSSFPSDHAAILFGLACAISGVSPVAGRAAYAVAIVLNFGRIYLGYHSPSDILSGALLGILAVKLSRFLACSDLSKNFYAVLMTKKPLFYACALSLCLYRHHV